MAKTFTLKYRNSLISVYMVIRTSIPSRLLFLTDHSTGSRFLDKSDTVLYTSPYYDEARHKKRKYYWVEEDDFHENDIDALLSLNIFHKDRLSQQNPFEYSPYSPKLVEPWELKKR